MTAIRSPNRRALVALCLLFSGHLLCLASGLGLLLIVYLEWTYSPILSPRGMAVGAAAGFLLIVSSIPPVERFKPPGPRLERARHPLLFAELDRIAQSLGLEVPREVYLTGH